MKRAPAEVTGVMEKLQQILPDSLSGNEVATDDWKTTATLAIN